MADDYKAGWSKGFEAGSPGNEIDAFSISSFTDDFRVGYVLGFGESAFPGVPPDYRYRMIGELAANARVPLRHFEAARAIPPGDMQEFRAGYLGDDNVQEDFRDDDDFDD